MDVLLVLVVIALIIGLSAFEGYMVMWAWHFFMAGMLGLPTLTFWPAFGLIIVCHILFKSSVSVNKRD